MALLPRAMDLGARWRERARGLAGRDPALLRVLSWLRTIALEGDVFCLDGPHGRDFHRFPFPSFSTDRPVRVEGLEATQRARFVIRVARRGGTLLQWQPIVRLRNLQVFERDTPHGAHRPLRLGLDDQEGWALLAHARRCAAEHAAGRGDVSARGSTEELARLSLRSAMGVALWTRGRLRGSVVIPPGPALRGVGQAAIAASQDARFGSLSADELAQTIVQVTVLHTPAVPLLRREIDTEDAYPDKGVLLSEETRSGVYLPEIFNVAPYRSLRALVTRLARDKAGLGALGPRTSVEVCEVTEFVESADRTRAVELDGPVARVGPWRSGVRAAGVSACAWLAAIQRDDGALPLRVRPSSGMAEGLDPPRMAMAAQGLAAYGTAVGLDSAIETARRAISWLDRARPEWSDKDANSLLICCYLGKAAVCLGDEAAVDRASTEALRALDRAPGPPLLLAHTASFLLAASQGRPEMASRLGPLQRELEDRFARATGGLVPQSLAEWAELVAAFDRASPFGHQVVEWLCSNQLPSGAFPDTTASDFVYSRGTGKVFEVLALRPLECSLAIERSLRWLLAMQYRADSMFFVPEEYRARVSGGLRHDMFDSDAWIDSAGHLLLGLARLEVPT